MKENTEFSAGERRFAKRELKDFRRREEMSVTLNGHTFTTWDDVEKDIFTPEEIAEAELKAAFAAEMVRAQKENGITKRNQTTYHKTVSEVEKQER